MKLKLRKIDAIIIVALIVIAGIVLFRAGYYEEPEFVNIPEIEFYKDNINYKLVVESVSEELLWEDIEISGTCDTSELDKYVTKGDQIISCIGTIEIKHIPTQEILGTYKFPPPPIPPSSYKLAVDRAVSPEDEGYHFDKLLVNREWWTYTVVFDEESDLPGWAATISFNHMAYGDLFGTFKPDLKVVTLHNPEGKEYGGITTKSRLFGKSDKLEASSPGVDITFGKSHAQGNWPNWYVYAEDEDIDENNDIILDLDYFAPSPPLWIHSLRPFDKGESKISCYMFTGCNVTGTVTINGLEYKVHGIGHHEHSWSTGLILKGLIKGWDWSHITLDNDWNIYFSNYYLGRQISLTKNSLSNPYGSFILTTDQGNSLTILDDIQVEVKKSEKAFLFIKMPTHIHITAKPSIAQPLLRTYNIRLELDIMAENTYDKIWKLPTFVGMKIGRSTITGKITWNNEEGEQEIELNGIGTNWNMRR